MKKTINFLLLVLILPSMMFLSACFGNENSNTNNLGYLNKLEISYIEDLKINLEGKQGLSIKKTKYERKKIAQNTNNSLLNLKRIV